MSTVEWFRVDDRLIHGQVMVGWIIALGIKRIILANDRIAEDPWYQDTLKTVVDSFSEDVDVLILSLVDTISCLEKDHLEGRQMLLVESIGDAQILYGGGVPSPVLTLGGIHAREGRDKLLPFLYLDSAEIDAILKLNRKGVRVIAQDLPDSKAVDVVKLIERKRRR